MPRDRGRDRDRARRHAHRDHRDRTAAPATSALSLLALPSVDVAGVTNALKNLPIAPTLLVLGAFALGRFTSKGATNIFARKKKSRTVDDAIDELMREPYMRAVGTPSPERRGPGRLLRDARRALFGETKAERTTRSIELEAKMNDAYADFAMLESSVGTSVHTALLETETAANAMLAEKAVDDLLLDARMGLLSVDLDAIGTTSIGMDGEWVLDQSVADTTVDDVADVGDVGEDFAAESALGPHVERTSSKLLI